MHYSQVLTAAVAVAGSISSALAQPTKRAVQSCHATDHGLFASYSVDIGITYANGVGCDDIYNAIENNVGISNWQCVADGSGNTQLYFDAGTYNAAGINSALEQEYPSIDGGFNCPDY